MRDPIDAIHHQHRPRVWVRVHEVGARDSVDSFWSTVFTASTVPLAPTQSRQFA